MLLNNRKCYYSFVFVFSYCRTNIFWGLTSIFTGKLGSVGEGWKLGWLGCRKVVDSCFTTSCKQFHDFLTI